MQLTSKDYINMTTTATPSSDYWTTTALSVTPQYQSLPTATAAERREERKYMYDFNGVKCFVTADAPNDLIPCEPFCNCCAFPTTLMGSILSPVEGAPTKLNYADVVLCDKIFTRCANPKGGRWFNEEREEWVEAEE